MKTKSEVLNRARFQIDNGVSHPAFGPGIIICAWGDYQWFVKFEDGTDRVVSDSDLISLPTKGLYRKSNRQLSMEAGRAAAKRKKVQHLLKEVKRRAKLKANQNKTRSIV